MAEATSSGWPKRWSGYFRSTASRNAGSSSSARVIGVSIIPGQTQLTRTAAALGAYAGGVHEGGEGGEVRDHLVHHPLARRRVGDVGLQRERLAARRADHARRFLRALAEAIDARDSRALGGEPARRRRA